MTAPRARGWEAITEVTGEYVDPGRVTAFGALLDSGAKVPGDGDPLPPLWHWVALPTWAPASDLDADGHPRRGVLLPPLDLPRRMFAGGEVTWHRPLRLGESVRHEARVVSVEEKSGRKGPFTLVAVRHRWYDERGELALEERRDLVYRESTTGHGILPDPGEPARLTPSGPPLRAHAGSPGRWDVVTDPTLLMRFSAVTANAHRIHYDWPYATRVEGYPGLVVHGPLSTLLLAEAIRLARPAAGVRRLRHRNVAPLFCAEPARIDLGTAAGSCEATLRVGDDRTIATVSADLTV